MATVISLDLEPVGGATVISVAMLGGGATAAAYYLDRAADCDLAGYYNGEVERPGRWCGHGSAALKLTGPFTGGSAADFAGLLGGRLPDGTVVARPLLRPDRRGLVPAGPLVRELRRAADARGAAVSELFEDPVLARTAHDLLTRHAAVASRHRDVALDAWLAVDLCAAAGLNPHVLYPRTRRSAGFEAALAHAGAKVDTRRSGLDVVVSAPKSVSVLYALGDPQVAATVLAAHERAVDEALAYLDRHVAHGLRGHQGGPNRARRLPTEGFVAAAFTHITSRADDPQLHTHLVLANLVRGVDGQWSAVDSRAVHRHARTAGCLYQAVLRGELTRVLGVEWGPVLKGVAEIAGIPRPVLRAFSTRRRAIEGELDRTGGTGRRAAQRAAYRTRPAKTHAMEPSLRDSWAQRVRALGHSPADLVTEVLGRCEVPAWPTPELIAAQMFGTAGLTEHATSFDWRDVIQALTETLPSGLPVTGSQLEVAANRMLREPDAVRLLNPDTDAEDGPRWTAAQLLATEQAALSLAQLSTDVPALDSRTAVAVAEAAHLSGEQGALVLALLQSPAAIDVVVGPAGSGKTALLRASGTGWREAGVPVLGCALAAVTARRLEAATGIPATSLARLLAEAGPIEPGVAPAAGLASHTVVVVDEASMIGTRDLAALAWHVAAARGKLVLVGDPSQLPEIDAGGLFAALAVRAQPLALSTNQRQALAWERDALLALRDGRIAEAVDAYLARGRIAVGVDAAEARARLTDAYVEHRRSGLGGYDVVALASTRADAATLNGEIRAALRAVGRLGPDRAVVLVDDDLRYFAVGDLVVVTRNDQPRGLLNGTRATIDGADATALTLQTETGVRVTVPLTWAVDHLDHGYALTAHKAQGLTTQVALVYGTAALCQQAGYVALSRGRAENRLFTSSESLSRPDAGAEADVPAFQLLNRADPADVLDELSARLGRRRRHTLARDQLPVITADSWDSASGRDPDDGLRSRHRDDERGLSR